MSTATLPIVLRRNRGWLRQQLTWRCIIALSAGSLVWATEGLSMPSWLRWTLVGLVALLAVRPSEDLDRTVTVDAEGLRRGFGRWSWSALTSVRPGPPTRSRASPPLGSVTLHFGDKAVSFGRDWPLEALLAEALSRAPLEAQLTQADARREREQGLDFGALWLGPSGLELRHGGKAVRHVDLLSVREVAMELSEHHAVLRLEEAGKEPLRVPLAELRDPQVLATLLARVELPWKRGPGLPLVLSRPLPTDATPELGRWRDLVALPLVLGVGLYMGVLFLGGGLRLADEGWDSYGWQPVPAEVLSARAYRPETYRRFRARRQGEVTFRFVFEGVPYTGSRFDVFGTSPGEAEALTPGQRVTAYVPSNRPGDAVLDPGIPFLLLLLFLGGGLVFVVMTLWFALTTLTDFYGWKQGPPHS